MFLYVCKTETLNHDLLKRIQVMEMRCFRSILQISHKDHVANNAVVAGLSQLLDLMKICWPLSKSASWGDMAMSVNQIALTRPPSKAQCQEPEEEEGNARGGKTTSKNEWAYLLLNHKIECNGNCHKKYDPRYFEFAYFKFLPISRKSFAFKYLQLTAMLIYLI